MKKKIYEDTGQGCLDLTIKAIFVIILLIVITTGCNPEEEVQSGYEISKKSLTGTVWKHHSNTGGLIGLNFHLDGTLTATQNYWNEYLWTGTCEYYFDDGYMYTKTYADSDFVCHLYLEMVEGIYMYAYRVDSLGNVINFYYQLDREV